MTAGRKGKSMTTLDRMLTLRAGDVMNRHVVKLSVQESMAEAAEKLLQNEISGAPVVDDQGHCIGILSAGDFVRRSDASSNSPLK
jgi:CBS domain-containing protein